MVEPLVELRSLVARHAASPTLPLSGVKLWLRSSPLPLTAAMYEPMLYFPLQGTKRLSSGDRTLEYGPGHFVLASLDVPVVGSIEHASEARPYLAVSVALDPVRISELILELPPVAEPADDAKALVLTPVTEPLLDVLVRLLRLLDAPGDVALLEPMIERELLYRMLQGPRGVVLRQIARADSRLSQVQRAVKFIRAHFTEPLPIETLAKIASMSVSSFHRHFKAVTGSSPLVFHKQVRLQEARRQLLAAPGAVATVACAVGYESVSQFEPRIRPTVRSATSPRWRPAPRTKRWQWNSGSFLLN